MSFMCDFWWTKRCFYLKCVNCNLDRAAWEYMKHQWLQYGETTSSSKHLLYKAEIHTFRNMKTHAVNENMEF